MKKVHALQKHLELVLREQLVKLGFNLLLHFGSDNLTNFELLSSNDAGDNVYYN
jgi:hypothetical protein